MEGLSGLNLLRSRMKQYAEFQERGLRALYSYNFRPEDVNVVGYPKSGTTWMQQIVYGLLTRGSMDFDSIGTVVPFAESPFVSEK